MKSPGQKGHVISKRGRYDGGGRRFVFLQGPHGPFFHELSRVLARAGAEVEKIGFNQGDAHYWRDESSFLAFREPLEEWPEFIRAHMHDNRVTDLVLYGDARFIHAEAIRIARRLGITVHCFEEGYLRPYWVTYERGGTNGNSRLMEMGIAQMQAMLPDPEKDLPQAPARWGDIRAHVWHGMVYHWQILVRNRHYPNWQSHREISVLKEARLNLVKFLSLPHAAISRRRATRRVRRTGQPYHLALLQLSHDASFRAHSSFASMAEFCESVIEAFAKGAPPHHLLVFKAHPLDDGREDLPRKIAAAAQKAGLGQRVHFVPGGKLAQLLDHARSVVTVNSTAAQQALWRGLPVKALGRSVYCKPELVSDQELAEFFADPRHPDSRAYRDYRRFLLATSQVPGGFYSARSRERLIPLVADMILAPEDPYDALARRNAQVKPSLRLVRG